MGWKLEIYREGLVFKCLKKLGRGSHFCIILSLGRSVLITKISQINEWVCREKRVFI